MDVYSEMAKRSVFSVKDMELLTHNQKTAYSQLYRLIKSGKVEKIRSNMYSAVNPTTGAIVANRFQVACAITESAYLSHHSAFEYYGMTNQIYRELYVSSNTRFNDFEFDNRGYKFVASRMSEKEIATMIQNGN